MAAKDAELLVAKAAAELDMDKASTEMAAVAAELARQDVELTDKKSQLEAYKSVRAGRFALPACDADLTPEEKQLKAWRSIAPSNFSTVSPSHEAFRDAPHNLNIRNAPHKYLLLQPASHTPESGEGRNRSMSNTSAGSAGSAGSNRPRDRRASTKCDKINADADPPFTVYKTLVHPTTTGTDSFHNTRPNALTTTVKVKSGDILLDMLLPCETGSPDGYDTCYEQEHPHPSVVFTVDGKKHFAKLVGPPTPEGPGKLIVSLAYYANDAMSSPSEATVKITKVTDTTCRWLMTARKTIAPGNEVRWAYAAGSSLMAPTYSHANGYGAPVFAALPWERLCAVTVRGAEVAEVRLTRYNIPGTGSCFYEMLRRQLTRLGRTCPDGKAVPKTSKGLRKVLSDHYLDPESEGVADGFATFCASWDRATEPVPTGLQEYRHEDRVVTLRQYAQRILGKEYYANHFDIVTLLAMFKVNLGMVVLTATGKTGYKVTPEVIWSDDADWPFAWTMHYRYSDDQDSRNHYDGLVPAVRSTDGGFKGDIPVLSFAGVLPGERQAANATASIVKSTAGNSAARAAADVAGPAPALAPANRFDGAGKGKGKAKRRKFDTSPTPERRDEEGGATLALMLARANAIRDNSVGDQALAEKVAEEYRKKAAEDAERLRVQTVSDAATAKELAKRLVAEEAAGSSLRSDKRRRKAKSEKPQASKK